MNATELGPDRFGKDSRPERLPNATAVLVLGILSLVLAPCYGVPGLTCGIIALVLSTRDQRRYRFVPHLYNTGSHETLKAGRICAIIGVCFAGPIVLLIIVYMLLIGSVLSMAWWHH